MATKYQAAAFADSGRTDLGDHASIVKAKDACQEHAVAHGIEALAWDSGTSGRTSVYLTARAVGVVYHVFYPEKGAPAVEAEPVDEMSDDAAEHESGE